MGKFNAGHAENLANTHAQLTGLMAEYESKTDDRDPCNDDEDKGHRDWKPRYEFAQMTASRPPKPAQVGSRPKKPRDDCGGPLMRVGAALAAVALLLDNVSGVGVLDDGVAAAAGAMAVCPPSVELERVDD